MLCKCKLIMCVPVNLLRQTYKLNFLTDCATHIQMHVYSNIHTYTHTHMCTTSVSQMTESMWKIGISKGKGEKVHNQYNRLYWRDYQISLVDEESQ